jgi:O-antigen ligase
LELAQDQHWTGYGYASFPSEPFERYWRYYSPPSAHNTFLQAYFETGLVGLSLVLGVTLMMLFSGLYISLTMGRISYSFFVGLYVILAGVLDTVLAGKLTILCTMMLLIAGQEANEFRQYRQNVLRGMA